MSFRRGQKVIWNKKEYIILGKEDFEHYEYNKPGEEWELIGKNGRPVGWVGNIHLKAVKG